MHNKELENSADSTPRWDYAGARTQKAETMASPMEDYVPRTARVGAQSAYGSQRASRFSRGKNILIGTTMLVAGLAAGAALAWRNPGIRQAVRRRLKGDASEPHGVLRDGIADQAHHFTESPVDLHKP